MIKLNYKTVARKRCKSVKPIFKRLSSASLLVTIALTSGCASYNRDQFTVGSVPDDYRTRHPIIVAENERAQDIVISRNTQNLPLRGRDIVRAMGLKFKSSGAKSIAILIPAGSPNERAARKAASGAVKELTDLGIHPSQISIQHYQAGGHGAAATLRIVYTDLVANVNSKCGEWNEDILDTKDNNNYRNFGCASQNNLAQMIANPADLLGPRGMSEIDSTKRTKVIQDWRETSTELTSSL